MSETIAKYQRLLEQHPDHELARFSLGKALYDTGRYAEARDQLDLALARKRDWMAVQILIGKCELALGHSAAAKESFERALRLAVDQNHDGPRLEMEELLAQLR